MHTHLQTQAIEDYHMQDFAVAVANASGLLYLVKPLLRFRNDGPCTT